MSLKNQLTTSDYLPYKEFQRLLDCLRRDEEYRWELYATLSFYTACRVSDVLTLHWKDVLDKTQVFIVEKKTKKTRSIVFNSSVQSKISELHRLLGYPDTDEVIFHSDNRRGLCSWTIQHVNRELKKFKRRYRLKVGNFSTHTFRKTFGRYVYEQNNRSAESLILLNKILNHSSIEITKVYIGITQDEVNTIYNSIQF